MKESKDMKKITWSLISIFLVVFCVSLYLYYSNDLKDYERFTNFDEGNIEVNNDSVILMDMFDTQIIDKNTRKKMQLGIDVQQDILPLVAYSDHSGYSYLVQENSISRYYFYDGIMNLVNINTEKYDEKVIKKTMKIHQPVGKLNLFTQSSSLQTSPSLKSYFFKEIYTQYDSKLYKGSTLISKNVRNPIEFSVVDDKVYYIDGKGDIESYYNGDTRTLISDKAQFITLSLEYIYYYSENSNSLVRVNRVDLSEKEYFSVSLPTKVSGDEQHTVVLSSGILSIFKERELIYTIDSVVGFDLNGKSIYYIDKAGSVCIIDLFTLKKEIFYE